jgi:transcription termination factor NusB
MNRDIRLIKLAQVSTNLNDYKLAAVSIAKVIGFILSKVPYDKKPNAIAKLREKIMQLNVIEMANKKTPQTASIGQSITFIKTILNGRDPSYIQSILYELLRIL